MTLHTYNLALAHFENVAKFLKCEFNVNREQLRKDNEVLWTEFLFSREIYDAVRKEEVSDERST